MLRVTAYCVLGWQARGLLVLGGPTYPQTFGHGPDLGLRRIGLLLGRNGAEAELSVPVPGGSWCRR